MGLMQRSTGNDGIRSKTKEQGYLQGGTEPEEQVRALLLHDLMLISCRVSPPKEVGHKTSGMHLGCWGSAQFPAFGLLLGFILDMGTEDGPPQRHVCPWRSSILPVPSIHPTNCPPTTEPEGVEAFMGLRDLGSSMSMEHHLKQQHGKGMGGHRASPGVGLDEGWVRDWLSSPSQEKHKAMGRHQDNLGVRNNIPVPPSLSARETTSPGPPKQETRSFRHYQIQQHPNISFDATTLSH